MNDKKTVTDLLREEAADVLDANGANSAQQMSLDLDAHALAGRVQRQLRKRQRRRQVAGGLTVITIVTMITFTGVFQADQRGSESETPKPNHVAVGPKDLTDAEIESLRQDFFKSIKQSDQIAQRLLQVNDWPSDLTNDDLLTIDDHMHHTALIILKRAKHKSANPQLHDSAMDDLRRLMALFPNSPLVPEARRQIEALQQEADQRRGNLNNGELATFAFNQD